MYASVYIRAFRDVIYCMVQYSILYYAIERRAFGMLGRIPLEDTINVRRAHWRAQAFKADRNVQYVCT